MNEIAYSVDVGQSYNDEKRPFWVTIEEVSCTAKTTDGEPLYSLCGGRLYQPAKYAKVFEARSLALSRAAEILLERAEAIRLQADGLMQQAREAAETACEVANAS